MRVVAFGDSFTVGEGVGVRIDPARTWVGLLAAQLGASVDMLARPGATVDNVLQRQLPRAPAPAPGDLATLLVGLNDVFRGGYDEKLLAVRLSRIVAQLTAYDTLLVGRWHNPFLQFALPDRLRHRLLHRLERINAAIDSAVATDARVATIDLSAMPGLCSRHAWAVDRVHPSEAGHREIADAALRSLLNTPAALEPGEPDAGGTVTRWDEGRWLVRYGAPWLLRRLRKVALPVVGLVITEPVHGIAAGGGVLAEPRARRGVPRGDQLVGQ